MLGHSRASPDISSIERHRRIWDSKPVLRLVYDDLFERIRAACAPGTALEIGSGSGNMTRHLPGLVASDVQFASWLDVVADAQRLPFADGTFDNIVMLDALHHIEYPLTFFRQAARILRPGGRLVMMEPAITVGSSAVYRFLHEEPVNMACDPLQVGEPHSDRSPSEANQAIPTLIATRYRTSFHKLLPNLRIVDVRWLSLLVYCLSGGFRTWSLLNVRMARIGLRIERRLEPVLGRLTGFRLLLVVEKMS